MTQRSSDQILTVAQMRAAEEALIHAGTSVDDLMLTAGSGAAEWIWRLAWPKPVTVLCGPGNNGGDGYVIAQALRERNLVVTVVAPFDPATDAARNAKANYSGPIWSLPEPPYGGVMVDCLFGSGLTRPLSGELCQLLQQLESNHALCVAVDLPSGVDSDSGLLLNEDLPHYDLTLALGAWKFAHWAMPASARMGQRRLVPIGVHKVTDAALMVRKPHLTAPSPDAHKYTRGLLAVISGEMPGAAMLASGAAMHGGAGYVKLVSDIDPGSGPMELVTDSEALADPRLSALLIGPGLGSGEGAIARLREALDRRVPTVLDADALTLLRPEMLADQRTAMVATPHEGELTRLAMSFGVNASGKRAVTRQLAERSGMVVIAKGPDTLIAAPDGRLAIAQPSSSWLSTAGTGDVLAGLVASRLATGVEPFEAACEAVWLHGEAARLAGPAFSASDLVYSLQAAYAACL